MEDPVPAIAEAEASGEMAALFADIRAVLGVGVVNLIWRHLATIKGALPWAWGTLRPAYADGSLAALAREVVPVAPPDAADAPAVLARFGVTGAERAAMRNVLQAYERTNPLALTALAALALALEGKQGRPAARIGAETPPPSPAASPPPLALPPLPRPGALAPATVALIRRLNALGARRPDAVLATMYRHLAHWPRGLAAMEAMLVPLAADGRLAASIAACLARSREAASRLDLPPAAAALPEASRAAVADALDRFGGEVLPRMVAVCAILRPALES